MKKIALLPLTLLLFGSAAFADDQLRNVQTELKELGFYYGEVSGEANAETTAAIRRYQIRNGLEVTGTLNQQTLAAIGMGPAPKAPKAAAKPAPAPTVQIEKKAPPVDLRRDEAAEDSDRNFLRQEENRGRTPSDPSVIDAPEPLEPPSADFPVLFAGTPYADAPLAVQQQMLRKAQSILASRGFYRDIVDGLPGPATEEALLTYQRAARLTLTGRLDLETLGELRLLSDASEYSNAGSSREPRRVYRGIWIDR